MVGAFVSSHRKAAYVKISLLLAAIVAAWVALDSWTSSSQRLCSLLTDGQIQQYSQLWRGGTAAVRLSADRWCNPQSLQSTC